TGVTCVVIGVVGVSYVMTAMTVIVGAAVSVLACVTVVHIVVRARGLRRRLRARSYAAAARYYATRRAVGWRLAGLGARIEHRRERRLAVRAVRAQAQAERPSPGHARRPERPVTT
ncbi:MAG: hypothetical protein ACRD0W_15150, partial [Acidimicrobiales bacterium]